jgi:membrane protease YdiL (CAAX protease family)
MTPSEPESPPAAAPPPPEGFWWFSDLFGLGGLARPAMLAGFGLVRGAIVLFRLHPVAAAEAIAQQFSGYFFLFLVLVLIFRLQYRQPFWRSLGWRSFRRHPLQIALLGWVTAIAVNVVGYLIHTPTGNNPLTDLMDSRTGLILVTLFGVTLGPLAEELAFRGFIQPLVVRSFGAIPGIVVTALPFGLLHFREYGNSWRHAVLICGAGAAFGWMRHVTNSTRASTIMHAAYNLLFFVALWATRARMH